MNIPLSKLVASRKNPRRVKPEREAHQRLVASIRAHGLLEPLIVRPENGHYEVVAGHRRLAALRAIYKDGEQKVACIVRKVDAEGAEELAVAENFIREPMHPLDEAEAFARMASEDRKGVEAIAAAFGVGETYVRQRMKLAGLADAIKAGYRAGEIDTGTAEAFAAVPTERQEQLWAETAGSQRHARHIRNLIEHQWIDAKHALFEVSTLPAGSVSSDLFQDTVLVERSVFMQAQAEALAAERTKLLEDGWSEVVIGDRSDVQSRLYAMEEPAPSFTTAEQAKLDKLVAKRQELESRESDRDPSEAFESIDREEDAIYRKAEGRYDEAVKSRGTVFLALSAEGDVERHYRVARAGRKGASAASGLEPEAPEPPLTANDLSDRQAAALFTHEAIAVRQAVSQSVVVRKRLLVLALHDKVRPDALALRRDTNTTSRYAESAEGFTSETFTALRSRLAEIDPFKKADDIDDDAAYRKLCKLPEKALDKLIAALVTELLTGQMRRSAPLIATLARELDVSVRKHWTPDASWFSSYQRIQLADVLGTLKGPPHGSAALNRKKSELVEELAALFASAANSDGPDDKELRNRVNAWLPMPA